MELEQGIKAEGCFDTAMEFVKKINEEYNIKELSEVEKHCIYSMFISRAKRLGRYIDPAADKIVHEALYGKE